MLKWNDDKKLSLGFVITNKKIINVYIELSK